MLEFQAMGRQTNPEKKEVLAALGAVLIFLAIVYCIYISSWVSDSMKEFPPGSNCSIAVTTYGARDLDDSYSALEKAKSIKDEFGIAELEKKDAAAQFPEGTVCLVLDTDFYRHFSFERKIRILGGVHMGKAFWVNKDDLKLGEPTPPPPAPVTCHDPNEYLGTGGDCWCKSGFKRDGMTQKCVPE